MKIHSFIMIALVSASLLASMTQAQNSDLSQTALEEIKVPLNDARGIGTDGVQAAAAAVSDDAQTIVLFGPTPETFTEVIEAARQVIHDQSTALNGVIVASQTNSGFGTEVALYVDGQLSTTFVNADGLINLSTLSDDLETALIANYTEILLPRRVREEQISE